MKPLLLLLSFAGAIAAQTHTCHAGSVQWMDAALYTRQGSPSDDLEKMLVLAVSYGCVDVQDKAVLVIFSFTANHPDNYIVIPAPWVTRVKLFEDTDAKPSAAPFPTLTRK